jgi:hypothetical protein
MLKLAKTPAYWWPVDYQQPGDGGVALVQKFDAQFAPLDDDAHAALLERSRTESLSDRQVVREVLRGVRHVVDEAGSEAPSTPETIDALLRLPGMGTTLWLAYSRSRAEAALGNLPTSPSGGGEAATQQAKTTTRPS